jgi:hypothetical protein
VNRPDPAILISGAAIMALGFVLLLDGLDGIHLDFGSLAPILLAVVGVILLAGGLARRDGA